MLLAIDNGNTNVKFALVDSAGEIVQRWRIATDLRRTADEYAVWLDQLLRMEGYSRADVTAVMVATVVPRALHNLQVLSQKYFGVEALVAGRAPVEWGIAVNVDEPRALGADRAVNAIAAQALEAGDKIVIPLAPRPLSTISVQTGPILAGRSRRGSTSASMRCTTPLPCCRASASNRRRTPG